jgi:hypothetical protein
MVLIATRLPVCADKSYCATRGITLINIILSVLIYRIGKQYASCLGGFIELLGGEVVTANEIIPVFSDDHGETRLAAENRE